MLPFDLHVLSIPPAFNLSQDQTLQFKSVLLHDPRPIRRRPAALKHFERKNLKLYSLIKD